MLLFLETIFWAFFEPGRGAVIPNITSSGEEAMVANAFQPLPGACRYRWGRESEACLPPRLDGTQCSSSTRSLLWSPRYCSRAMRFHEPHLDHAMPLHARELMDFSPVTDGIRYIRKDTRLVATLFVKTGTAILGANWIILPIYGERLFRVGGNEQSAGVLGMSLLLCSRGIGALIGPCWRDGGLVTTRIGCDRVSCSPFCSRPGYMLVAWAPVLWIACAAVALAHSGGSIAWVFSTTMLQKYTEDKFRGRVFSLSSRS